MIAIILYCGWRLIMLLMVNHMRVMCNLRWWAITSFTGFVFCFPVLAFAVSVERSAYDWDVAASDSFTIPIIGVGDADDIALREMVFTDGDAEKFTIQPAPEELAAVFSLDFFEDDDGAGVVVRGSSERFSYTNRVLAVVISDPMPPGGSGVRTSVAVPLFLRSSVDLERVAVEALDGPRIVFGNFSLAVSVANAAAAPVVPDGSFRVRPLLGGERSVPVNPGALRIPAGTKRMFEVPFSLPVGVWHISLPTADGEVTRWVVVLAAWMPALFGVLVVILGRRLFLRHALSRRP
jgi:hypothetical protein